MLHLPILFSQLRKQHTAVPPGNVAPKVCFPTRIHVWRYTGRIDGSRFNEEITQKTLAMEVWHGISSIKTISKLIHQGIQIEFPKSSVETVRLKLLNKVSVSIFEVVHHLAD